MAKAAVYYNAKCLCCGKVEEVMAKVGPMVFCNECLQTELVDKGMEINERGEVDPLSKTYKKWIKI